MCYPTGMNDDPWHGELSDDDLRREAAKPLRNMGLREPRSFYDASPPELLSETDVASRRLRVPAVEKGGGKMKTSVYLEPADVRRLGWLADVESRPQAEIIRDAIRAYYPKVDRDFELFKGVPADATGVDVTQEDIDRMMVGFGEDSPGG